MDHKVTDIVFPRATALKTFIKLQKTILTLTLTLQNRPINYTKHQMEQIYQHQGHKMADCLWCKSLSLMRILRDAVSAAVFAWLGGHAVEPNSPGTASLLEKHTVDSITKELFLNQQRQANDSRWCVDFSFLSVKPLSVYHNKFAWTSLHYLRPSVCLNVCMRAKGKSVYKMDWVFMCVWLISINSPLRL